MATGGWVNTAASTTDATWSAWTSDTTATSTGTVWIRWCDTTATASATIDTNNTWDIWASDGTGSNDFQQLTPEQEQQIEEYNRVAEQRWRVAQKEREEAQKRALKLLRESLSEIQRAAWDKGKEVIVTGSEGRQYRIVLGRSHNVEELDKNGKRVRSLCAHPAMDVPDEDTVLAQKLMLETDEAAFRKMANFSRAA